MNEQTPEQIAKSNAGPSKVPDILEAKYPQYSRLHKGWKLLGFRPKNKHTGGNRGGVDGIPMYQFYDWDRRSKYTGEKLRAIRRAQLEKAIGDRTTWDDGTPLLRSNLNA